MHLFSKKSCCFLNFLIAPSVIALTRTNQAITEGAIKEFIETLNVSEDIKKELRVITPHNYTGI